MKTVLGGMQIVRHMAYKMNPAEILNPNRGPVKMPKGYEKIIAKRKMIQEPNGLPMYLKGSSASIMLYRITFTVVLMGNGYILTQVPSMIK